MCPINDCLYTIEDSDCFCDTSSVTGTELSESPSINCGQFNKELSCQECIDGGTGNGYCSLGGIEMQDILEPGNCLSTCVSTIDWTDVCGLNH